MLWRAVIQLSRSVSLNYLSVSDAHKGIRVMFTEKILKYSANIEVWLSVSELPN
jgi:hypothetical protein